ncbi:MAG TPA: DUF2017 domain-containing protein [Microbacterium sp.]|nr:DUF2017 domain-containing protein [Microbacterium sp.]
MTEHTLILTISRLEAQQLADLVAQFSELLEPHAVADSDSSTFSNDPVLARLAPSAYPDDPEAAAEFRDATRHDLLERRQNDALRVLADLAPSFASGDVSAPNPAGDTIDLAIEGDAGWAWMRTLTAIRLVIATRLGISEDDDHHDPDDDRFAVYDWIGYRLDGIVRALEDSL